jgi:hypothetical protein
MIDRRPLVIGGAFYAHSKTVLTGQGTLAVGSVLGVVTSGGKLKLTDSGNGDGSETPAYVLTKSVDTSDGDVTGVSVLKAGYVNAEKLVFGGTDTFATHDVALKGTGIIGIEGEDLDAYDNT